MVRTWNQDPSNEIACAKIPNFSTKAHKLQSNARFVRDGTGRIKNFLNAVDGQGYETPATSPRPIHTATHALFEDTLYNEHVAPTIEAAVALTMGPTAGPSSRAARIGTERGFVGNDPRFGLIRDPYPEPLGPGQYTTPASRQSMGTLDPKSTLRGCSPSRDPLRMSASFISPSRQKLKKVPATGPDVVYITAEDKIPRPKILPLSASDQRPEASDWRHASRVIGSGRDLPQTQYEVDVDAKGVNMTMSRRAISANTVLMSSPMPRLATLPTDRTSDLRRVTPQVRIDSSHLGPGSYSPLRSLGAAKRKTYRLYSAGNADATMASAEWGRERCGSSTPFTSIARDQMYGPFTNRTDSSLARIF